MKIKLKLLCEILETVGAEDDSVLGDPVVSQNISTVDSLKDSDRGGGDAVKPEADMVSVGGRPVLNNNFSLTVGARQVFQIL